MSAVKSKNDAINQLMFLDPSDENKSLETGGERIIVIQKSDGGCRPYLPRDRLVLGISTPNTALRYMCVLGVRSFTAPTLCLLCEVITQMGVTPAVVGGIVLPDYFVHNSVKASDIIFTNVWNT